MMVLYLTTAADRRAVRRAQGMVNRALGRRVSEWIVCRGRVMNPRMEGTNRGREKKAKKGQM